MTRAVWILSLCVLVLAPWALAQDEPALAHLVDLKFFCGFPLVEIAAMTGVSERTAQRQWDKARMLLRHALEGG